MQAVIDHLPGPFLLYSLLIFKTAFGNLNCVLKHSNHVTPISFIDSFFFQLA